MRKRLVVGLLTPVFLEGSLHRALNPLTRPAAREVLGAVFDSPAPNSRVAPPATVARSRQRR